mgnify:CR=1 FL=1
MFNAVEKELHIYFSFSNSLSIPLFSFQLPGEVEFAFLFPSLPIFTFSIRLLKFMLLWIAHLNEWIACRPQKASLFPSVSYSNKTRGLVALQETQRKACSSRKFSDPYLSLDSIFLFPVGCNILELLQTSCAHLRCSSDTASLPVFLSNIFLLDLPSSTERRCLMQLEIPPRLILSCLVTSPLNLFLSTFSPQAKDRPTVTVDVASLLHLCLLSVSVDEI